MNHSVIEVEAMSFGYDIGSVLSDVNLHVVKGDFLAIVGPNGGGKTTLLRLLLGLLHPDSGQVKIFGHKPGKDQGRIGYVPQHGNLAPGFPASVEEVVLMGLPHGRRHGFWYRADERERAHSVMRQVGVEALASKRMEELSGGQRQRVLMARALITDPELLLLDEPLANIDPYGRQCVLESLAEQAKETTIVMVSHDLGITSNVITGIVAVNRYVMQSPDRHLSPEMLNLMYGMHDPNCPAHEAIQHLASSVAGGTTP